MQDAVGYGVLSVVAIPSDALVSRLDLAVEDGLRKTCQASGVSWPRNSQLAHAELQRGALHAQPRGCAIWS